MFLVIDDYNELIYLQTLLKKLGFDVEGLQNQKKYADLSLGFNPQILITTALGKKVDGFRLAESIHKRRGLPKIIALATSDKPVTPHQAEQVGFDQVLDSPINPKKLILALAALGGVDETALLEKYTKVRGTVQAAGYSPSGAATEPGESADSRSGSSSSEIHETVHFFDENGQAIEDERSLRSAIEALGGSKQFPLEGHRHESDEVELALKAVPDSGIGAPTKAALAGSSSSGTAAVGSESVAALAADALNAAADASAGRAAPSAATAQTPGATSPLLREDGERQKRFKKFQTELGELPDRSFNRERIREFNKKIRSVPPSSDAAEIDDEKLRFIRAMFKK